MWFLLINKYHQFYIYEIVLIFMLRWKYFKNFTKSSFRLILNDIKPHLKVKIKSVNKFQFKMFVILILIKLLIQLLLLVINSM